MVKITTKRFPTSINKLPPAGLSPEERQEWLRYRGNKGVSKSDFEKFYKLAAKMTGANEMNILQVDPDLIAKRLSAQDDAEAAAKAKPRGRGRPASPKKHLRIMVTIEAYIGAGLSRKDAEARASDH
jgi:hypothetical protein